MSKFKIDKSKCVGCGACVNTCLYEAIEIGKDDKAIINKEKCKNCGKCKKICPFNAILEK
ncbi:4Fe-4S binding protein [Candidatus Wolfebacteria bacterium]|nr:4Fe-4S binding protein [Candidatus Wolfebacteria bacterium]